MQTIEGTQIHDFIAKSLKVRIPKETDDYRGERKTRMTFQEFITHPFVNDFHYIRKLLNEVRE
jgi:hypothetical protein